MNKKVKFWLTAGLITVITGTGTAAMAADGAQPFIKKLSTPQVKATNVTTTTDGTQATVPQDRLIRGGHHGGGLMIINDELFTLLKLTHEEFRTQAEAGKTLLQIATAQGVTEQQLTDFLTKQHTAHLDQHVTDGKLTQEQADTMKANLPEQIKNMINNTLPARPGGKGLIKMKFDNDLHTLFNITEEQLRTELQSGKTLLDIAKAHNVTEQQLTDYLTKQHTAKIDQAVTDGKLTQEQADKMKADFPEHIKNIINNTPPAGPEGFGKGGMDMGGLKFGEELFTFLNITKEQFQTECKAGKTLLEIATAKNITEQQLTDFFTKQATDRFEQAVKVGKMTQAQADQLKASLPETISKAINSKVADSLKQGKGKAGMKGPRGGDQTQPAQQPTQQTKTTTKAATPAVKL